ncbi:MAG TPA: flap endonuclease-1 [Methanosarcinales archaeon]|nr:flap endonuclease-1 [Methanosarcinales archaeon]
MGSDIGDLFEREETELERLRGQTIAIDAYNTIYQFLSSIRQRDGTPLKDSHGRVTSHLSGLLYRTTNLVEAGLKLVFVFDGAPPDFKAATIEKRTEIRDTADRQWKEALAAGSEDAFKYAQATSRLKPGMVEDAELLLASMGIPVVQAASEGEAQAAYMAKSGDVRLVGSQDYDSLLFGAPEVVRNLAIGGRRKLPKKNIYVEVKPEVIELQQNLDRLGITREQLIDIAMLAGTDYNPGIRGIGAKKALQSIQRHESIEDVLAELGESIENLYEIRDFFLNPAVTSDYSLKWKTPLESKIKELLCDEHDFSEARVTKAAERLTVTADSMKQSTLDLWG